MSACSPHLPAELEATLVRHAIEDADAVIGLLDDLGFRKPVDGGPPVRLPAAFLLGLGLALRLFVWEARGLRVHRDAGLPAAGDVLDVVVRQTAAPKDTPPAAVDYVRRLRRDVLRVTAERFAWSGPSLLGAEVVVGDVNEEQLLDALAHLVWNLRHDGA